MIGLVSIHFQLPRQFGFELDANSFQLQWQTIVGLVVINFQLLMKFSFVSFINFQLPGHFIVTDC